MIVTLDAKRRLSVPAALAPASPGDCFDARVFPTGWQARRIGLPCSKPAQSVRKMCLRGVVPQPGAASNELAARHGCHLPAGQAARRCAGCRLGSSMTKTAAIERRRHCPSGLLGYTKDLLGYTKDLLGYTKDGRQRLALQAWLTRLVEGLQGRVHGLTIATGNDRDVRSPDRSTFFAPRSCELSS